MKLQYLELSYWQLGLAAGLILINGIISVSLKLGLEKKLLVASVRTVSQLILIGLVLKWVFLINNPYLVLGLGLLMALIAGFSAVGRVSRHYRGIYFDSIVSIWASSWLMAAVVLLGILRIEPWFTPQYAIPFLGMILGNALTGISLGLDRFGGELHSKRKQVELALSLGATKSEASRELVRKAVTTGMIPIINNMMVVGIVSLPGMMTGQLLAGVDPIEAVKYQIVIMFLIASATALGTVGVILLSRRRFFNHYHQFESYRLSSPRL